MMFWFDQVVLVGVVGLVSMQLSTVSIHQSKRMSMDSMIYRYICDTRLRAVCLDAGAGCIEGCELRKQALCCRGAFLRRYCFGLEAVETLL